ncbi:Flagellar motor switch protein FliG [bioreactor metagenome]|uniref:Flagellar motor switch protein FliG n=1 Tax=bioreactor metagenome TaxID=1076179 RepID=A0A644WIJ3_9ZZZZ
MESTSPEVVKDIERHIEHKMSMSETVGFTEIGGTKYIAEVLNSVDRSTEKYILEELAKKDPKLSEEIRKSMFVFEDISKLSNQAIQTVLKQVDQTVITVALKGANDEVKKYIMSNLSKRLQEMINDDLEVMGPMKIRDVEEAQQKIVNTVRTLEESGEIIVSRGDGSDVLL